MQPNDSSSTRILRLFLLTKWELLVIIVLSGALLLSAFYSLGVQHSETVSEFQTFTEIAIVGRIFAFLRAIADTVITANVATMLLWGVIGSFVYSIITGVQAALSDASGAFKTAFLYVHPAGYSKKEYLLQVVVERLVSIMAVSVTIIYVWMLLTYVVPVVYEGTKESIIPLSMQSFLSAGYFVFFAVLLHGLVVLMRIGAGRYRPDRI